MCKSVAYRIEIYIGVNMPLFVVFRAKTIITDLVDFVPLMKQNIEENKKNFVMDIEARELKWGTDIAKETFCKDVDVVVVADCIYYEEVI